MPRTLAVSIGFGVQTGADRLQPPPTAGEAHVDRIDCLCDNYGYSAVHSDVYQDGTVLVGNNVCKRSTYWCLHRPHIKSTCNWCSRAPLGSWDLSLCRIQAVGSGS